MSEYTDLSGNRYSYDERGADHWAEAFEPAPRKTDRIERGVSLSARGHVKRKAAERWTVRSERDQSTSYEVTPHYCACRDSGRNICKHQWASVGIVCAIVILALRKARTVGNANRVLESATAEIAGLPLGYRRTLNDEYCRAVGRISRQQVSHRRAA